MAVEHVPMALPGERLVRQGLRDLEEGIVSVESLLVSIGAPRLRRLGLTIPTPLSTFHVRLAEVPVGNACLNAVEVAYTR